MPTLLRIKDLAELLDVTPQTVHNMLNDKRIPVDPIPNLKPRRWNADKIREWIDGQAGAAS